MAKIICPNCGEVIDVDPSAVEDLTRQLRDELFERDLEARLAEQGHTHEAEVAAVRAEERREADRRVAQAQGQTAELQAKLNLTQQEQLLVIEQERKKAQDELAALKAQLLESAHERELAVEHERAAAKENEAQMRAQLEASVRERDLAVEQARREASEAQASLQHELDSQRAQAQAESSAAAEQARQREAELAGRITALEAQLEAQGATLKAQGEAELLRATANLERKRGELESELRVAKADSEQAQAALREEMARREAELTQQAEKQIEVKNEQIEQYKSELERLRDYRMRLSTKLIGESLERHCESEFNRIRIQAYPKATFEKDNTAVEGTKGDFIFRDYDDDGSELLSIMFEMKTEEESSLSASRKRNEDHFKKLDADRTKKGCEYAVLVSTLEPDNDFYNAGIADVSWHYPKMFVVRPQCFTTIIGLLKAAALTAHPYRMQLERARREELDVSTFEEKVATIVGSIENDYERAAKNYERAEEDIDNIIKKLQDLKKQLKTATTWFGAAQKHGEKLSVKRLTRGNQTMKAAFAELAKASELSVDGSSVEPADLADDDAIDPDETE